MSALEPEKLADDLLEMVGDQAEALVTVSRTAGGLTRFANSRIHQNVGGEQVSVSLQVTEGGRTAATRTDRVGTADLRRLVEHTLEGARVRPVDPDWPGLCPAAPLRTEPDSHYDRATAEAGPGERADVVAAFVAAGQGLEAAGYCETTYSEGILANSAGQHVGGRATSAVVDGVHRTGTSDGCGSVSSTALADVDGRTTGTAAADRARRGRESIELPPGHYEVVLEPRCVAQVLQFLAFYGFNARAVQEGRSFASLGDLQIDPSLSIWDDATDPRQQGMAFDSEGTPKRRVPLVESGVTVGLTHDRRTSRKAGGQAVSTGHCVPGGESVGALAQNVLLDAAAGHERLTAAAMIGEVERGLLVSDLWYIRVLDPKSLVVTGLTRNGVFLVEDGKVGPAVSDLRFTQSPVAGFGPGRVLGIGDDACLDTGGFAWHHTPSLHLAEWNFTGNASG